jgi:raffinose/stachyose/melibiose transport system permease protein
MKQNNVVEKRNWIAIAIMLVVAFGQLFPLVWLVDFSLNKSGDLFASGILKIPDPPQWQNYAKAWVDGKVPLYLLNSIIVNVITITIAVLLSMMMSYAFVRMKWKLRGVFLTIVLLGMMIPIHATLLPNFITFRLFGLLDTYQGLIIPYVAFSMPLGVFIMTGFLESIPRALEESAVIDGCNIFGIIFRIIFPITKPAIVTITVMTFLNTWNEFIMAVTYLSTETLRTLPFSVWNFAGQYASDYSAQFAVMTLTAIPAIIVYILLNEQITKGITLGAVKG